VLLRENWFWICWEVAAAIGVAVGCTGEWYLIQNKPTPDKAEEHHRNEVRLVLVVAVGVTMELIALAHVIPETMALEKEAQQLRLNADELEFKRLQRVGQYDWSAFRKQLKGTNGIRVELLYANEDEESYNLARRIKSCLNEQGWIGIGPVPLIMSNNTQTSINDIPGLIKIGESVGDEGIAPSINRAGARFGQWGMIVNEPGIMDVITNSHGKIEWVESADNKLMNAIVSGEAYGKHSTVIRAWSPDLDPRLPDKFIVLIIGTKDADLFWHWHKPSNHK
jgi:hypothetical protein